MPINKKTSTVSTPIGNNEPTYTIDEIAKSKIFPNVPAFAVKAALKAYGNTEYTLAEAKSIIPEFLKGEVTNG